MTKFQQPHANSYDVVIIGGAMMGSSAAWFLTRNPDFQGSVLVVEMDPSYAHSSTAHTNSCMRQQFSSEINVHISQYAADFVQNLRSEMGNDARVPDLDIQNFGYLYLADNEAFADTLRANHKIQRAAGAETELLTGAEIAERYPFYNVDDVILGSINRKNEGYWDGGTVFEWWRRKAKDQGAEYIQNRVMDITVQGGTVQSITLETGDVIACGQVINASGPRAAHTAQMAGLGLPVEPRKRYTWVFGAERPLDRDLPLTIDPSGVHVRQDGPQTYMVGVAPDPEEDIAVHPADFTMDHARWEDHVWPLIAARIPQFEAIKVIAEWVGHYAYNTFDQNAVLGPHPEVRNFLFLNGFSGHGLQQSPAMGRAIAEWVIYGDYRALDMSSFSYDRIGSGQVFVEKAVI